MQVMTVRKIGYQKAPHSVRTHRYTETLGIAVKRSPEVGTQGNMTRNS